MYLKNQIFRGENEPIRKGVEKSNSVFMGSLVRNGHGLAVVYAIGNNTNLGSVMKMVAEVCFSFINYHHLRLIDQLPHFKQEWMN